MAPALPVLSIRDATLTVLPQMSAGHMQKNIYSAPIQPTRFALLLALNVDVTLTIMRLSSTDHTSRDRPMVDAHFQYKMIEALLIDALQRLLQLQRKLDQCGQLIPSHRHRIVRVHRSHIIQTAGGHVRGANCLNFDHILEVRHGEQLEWQQHKARPYH